jgi:hypothetical protein
MHRPAKMLSAEALVRVVFTAIVLLPPQATLAVHDTHSDPDRVTSTLMAQDLRPIEPFRGIERR